jgi:pleiotropic regulator 1
MIIQFSSNQNQAITQYNPYALHKPTWHAPWKLMRVISGHVGWVYCVAVDISNEWFVTGSADSTVKVTDQ